MQDFNIANRGSPKEFSNKKINTLIVTMLYPAVLSYCYKNMKKDEAEHSLKKLGWYLADFLYEVYEGNKSNFQEYLKDFFKFFYFNKIKIEQISENSYRIYDKKCMLCSDIEIEGLRFHNCIPYAGTIEKLLYWLATDGKIPNYKYNVETIASKSSGDRVCIHEIQVRKK